jgi:hypothetical protein
MRKAFIRIQNQFGALMILAGAFLNVASLVLTHLPRILQHESVGYGDSYIWQTVERFRSTGVLYPAFGPDHLTPTLYSPLLYLTISVAAAVTPDSPFLGPRLLELAWFLACIGASALLARELVPGRRAFLLGLLLASSYSFLNHWVLQFRGDFPGIACALLAVYLLMRRRTALAGLCAGLALQFKITFVAAALAGGLWLLIYRRWRDFGIFAAVVLAVGAGGYLLVAVREPHMISNITMMRKLIPHPAGVVSFIRRVLADPVFLLAMASLWRLLPFITLRGWRRWQLLVLFLVASSGVAIVTSLQAGASINYFYDVLLAATPLAILGLIGLKSVSGAAGRTAVLLLGLILLFTQVLPKAAAVVRETPQVWREVAERNRQYDALRAALRNVRILSFLPDVTLLSKERIIVDPTLFTYRVLTSGVDTRAVTDRLRAHDFDVVVTPPADYSWRTLPWIPPAIRDVITSSYKPYCKARGALFHLPPSPDDRLKKQLQEAGCEVLTCGPANPSCPGLSVPVEAF